MNPTRDAGTRMNGWFEASKGVIAQGMGRMLRPGFWAAKPAAGVDFKGAFLVDDDGVWACQPDGAGYQWELLAGTASLDDRYSKNLTLYINPSVSTAINNTTNETAFDRFYTIPANSLLAGDALRITASGSNATHSSGTVNITLRVRIGGVAGTILVNNPAITLSTSTAYRWQISATVVVRTVGAAAATSRSSMTVLDNTGTGALVAEFADGGTANTFNSTVSNDLVVTADHGAANAANTATLTGLVIERLRV